MKCGTVAGYQAHHDRGEPACQPCRTAQADWNRHYRTRMYLAGGPLTIDATGTRRRLQALMRIGWSADAMAPEVGSSASAIRQWMVRGRVRRATAAKVAAIYDELWDQPGPSVKTRSRARAADWPPPLAWNDEEIDDPAARPYPCPRERCFDEVAVQRAMHGDRVHLRPVERAEATRRLTALRLSAAQISERLGVTKRSVVRQRNRPNEVA